LSGLSLGGLGIDYLRHCLDSSAPLPRWPLDWRPPDTWSPLAVIMLVGGGVLALALLRATLEFLAAVQTAQLIQGRIVVDLRAQVYDKLQRLSYKFFDAHASSSIINRVTSDVQSTRLFIDTVLLQGAIMLLSLIIYFSYMVMLHPPLTFACLATAPAVYLISLHFARTMRPLYMRSRDLMDKMVASLAETVQGIRVIKGFAREAEVTDRFFAANAAVNAQQISIFKTASFYGPMLAFTAQVSQVILLAYGGYLVINHRLPLGAGLIVFSGLLQQFCGQIANLANLANSVQESLASARRIFEVMDAKIEITSKPNAIRLPQSKACSVTFEKVRFGYEPDEPVLRDLNFHVGAGQYVAILGATGSGKSTLLSLIPRFYDPQAGRILIDGVDARDLDLDDLRRNIGVVFQENFLFSTTIRENIAFGRPTASQAEIENAARIAAAHDFIMALPQKYDTVLAEEGGGLSGGQRQRLGIARAILLNPGILLLDDPTAAIDPETEQEILDAMESARAGRTTFIIAHRLSTLQRVDKILVLQGGRIVQIGTHEELMAVKGPYRWMASTQMADSETVRLLAETAERRNGS